MSSCSASQSSSRSFRLADADRRPNSNTNPRTLLRVAPTIVKQSLCACQAGVIDLDTLREGLSYFLQELLSFTLPGVVWWLAGEIERTPCNLSLLSPPQVLKLTARLPADPALLKRPCWTFSAFSSSPSRCRELC